MDIFEELSKLMDDFSENIAKEVAEKRIYNIDEVRALVKTRLWLAIYSCLKLQVTRKEEERRKLVQEYTTAGKARIELGGKIAKVNAEKADANRILTTMVSQSKYDQLKKYVREKYGHVVWKDFIENYLNMPNSDTAAEGGDRNKSLIDG